jgi:putative phosphoesterase
VGKSRADVAGQDEDVTRIGVVSDTHLPRFGRALPGALVAGFEGAGVEMVLHLGDFTDPFVPALFEVIAPLAAVAGNNDGPELVARFGRRQVVEVDGVRIGMTHGDLGAGATTPERARRTFAPDEVDVIAFGHSHVPLLERVHGGPLLLNPGSPTDKRRQPVYTWGLLEVREGAVLRAELRAFDRDHRPE